MTRPSFRASQEMPAFGLPLPTTINRFTDGDLMRRCVPTRSHYSGMSMFLEPLSIAECSEHKIKKYHCVLFAHSLCRLSTSLLHKAVKFRHVMSASVEIVNFIRSRGFNPSHVSRASAGGRRRVWRSPVSFS